jgi:hypothetical protein
LRIRDTGDRQIIRKGVERFDGAIEQVKFQAQSGLTALW